MVRSVLQFCTQFHIPITMANDVTNSVLIVDDEVAIRTMLQRLFGSAGLRVGAGANGVEGLNLFYGAHWDVVVVDRGMPEMNGEEMAMRIQETHPHVPLILITGLPNAVKRPDLFVATLAKPFRPTDLVDVVARAIATSVLPPMDAEERRPRQPCA